MESREYYLSNPLYEMFVGTIEEVIPITQANDITDFQKIEENDCYIKYQWKRIINDEKYDIELKKANVAFMFNYANEPNAGYFFIDNFDYGERIKNPSYEPLRNGYSFGGWFKEAKCQNKWDFEKDTLPEAKYNEDGNLKFTETKLYALWLKK